jgi:hypothetical protein
MATAPQPAIHSSIVMMGNKAGQELHSLGQYIKDDLKIIGVATRVSLRHIQDRDVALFAVRELTQSDLIVAVRFQLEIEGALVVGMR